jgi:hypothetical protein
MSKLEELEFICSPIGKTFPGIETTVPIPAPHLIRVRAGNEEVDKAITRHVAYRNSLQVSKRDALPGLEATGTIIQPDSHQAISAKE